MESKPDSGLCDKARSLCSQTRKNFIEIAELLYKIRESDAWAGTYSSFAEFTDDCQLNRSFATKLLRVYDEYVINRGISAPKLVHVSHEKLYDAIPLLGSKPVDEVLEAADTYSQKELREVVKPCDHEPDMKVVIHPCKHCGRLMRP